jgi:hypothetical protein
MGNASLERRKARFAELGGWKGFFSGALIPALQDMVDVIVPVVFNRTVFLAFVMCLGITWRYQSGDVSAETGGMVIAFTLLWLISDQLLHPFFRTLGSVHWELIGKTGELNPDQKANRTEARASLITLLLLLAVVGVWARVNVLSLVFPVLILATVCFGALFALRVLGSVSKHFLDSTPAA